MKISDLRSLYRRKLNPYSKTYHECKPGLYDLMPPGGIQQQLTEFIKRKMYGHQKVFYIEVVKSEIKSIEMKVVSDEIYIDRPTE